MRIITGINDAKIREYILKLPSPVSKEDILKVVYSIEASRNVDNISHKLMNWMNKNVSNSPEIVLFMYSNEYLSISLEAIENLAKIRG